MGFTEKTRDGVAWLEPDCSSSHTAITLAFFERTGGVSSAPYASLNVGALTEDSEADVEMNRQIALSALDLDPEYLALKQVHGNDYVTITADAWNTPIERAALLQEAERGKDAFVCTAPNVTCMLVTADCAPVAILSEHGFTLAHCGWKGTLLKAAARTVEPLSKLTQDAPSSMRAYIGPHIGPKDFEVSEELEAQFVAAYGSAVAPYPRHLDLAFAITQDLISAGISPEHIEVADVSTTSHTKRFFSYRMEGENTGRQATIVCMRRRISA